ncbi:hypothetical protein WJX72_004544 [[Myrmecia] bisecta]|uniref:Tyrosinase copper-binding domain-containing protein n=1 Tax=[Myrmecia] bisecta TaxID=41462 RepID=A0AAW1R6D9_9CHLO
MSGGGPVPVRPQAQSPVVLEPPTERDGSVAVRTRLDITKIATEPALRKQRDLLLLAWEKLQYGNPDAGDPKTFFQIGGIHGWPYVPYNKDGSLDGPQMGYCWHGAQLFPTWHRPYVALFEQELRRWATSIAAEYTGPDAADYVKAAEDLRLPYWNWLENNSQVPTIITDSQVTVNAPTGQRTINPNPLSTFVFPTPPLGAGYTQLPNTPNANDPPPATPRSSTARQPLSGGIPTMNSDLAADFRTQTSNWRLMLLYRYQPNQYSFFADHSPPSPAPIRNPVFDTSLEGLHDLVHVNVGGIKGHMSYPQVAGMDPIFWFHHCQVDRLLSQWQASHPLCFVQNVRETPDGGTFLTGGAPVRTSATYP